MTQHNKDIQNTNIKNNDQTIQNKNEIMDNNNENLNLNKQNPKEMANQFYNGSKGMLVQILIMIATLICYILIRKLRDVNDGNYELEQKNNVLENEMGKLKGYEQMLEQLKEKYDNLSFDYQRIQRENSSLKNLINNNQ